MRECANILTHNAKMGAHITSGLRFGDRIGMPKQTRPQPTKQSQLAAEEELVTITRPLEWYIPPDMITRYATNMLIQHGENEFFISFFEFRPPVIMGTPEEQKKQADQLPSVRAECVARITVAEKRLPEFIRVMQDFTRRFVPDPTE